MNSEAFLLQTASLTDPGKVRSLNEDAVATGRQPGFAIVADGMGGHRAGDVASRLALETAIRAITAMQGDPSQRGAAAEQGRQWAEEVLHSANTAVHAAALANPGCKDMGVTMALAVFDAQRVTLAHVGDSRIYRLRDGRLELLTRDDSLLNDQLESGLIAAEDAGESHNRHLVTRALGTGATVDVHVREEDLNAGDVYLLCTDGLNDMVDEQDIALILDALKTNLDLAAFHLVQLANDCGGYDNVTVALVRVLDQAPATRQKSWFGRVLARLLGRQAA